MVKWIGLHSKILIDLNSININWNSFKVTRKESTFGLKTFITKWIRGDKASPSKVMVERKQRKYSNCPQYHQDDEHHLHLFTSNSVKTITIRDNLLEDFKNWLKSAKTHSRITHFFRIGLKKWFKDHSLKWDRDSRIFTDNDIYNSAFQSQLKIG